MVSLIASVHAAAAQETINYASVSGRVSDPQGAVVSGATVTARQTDTAVTATVTTDEAGRFRFPYLRIGPYELSVTAAGFDPSQRPLVLNAGAAFEIPITLRLGGLAESVAVRAESPIVETARSPIATTVPREEISNLPLNGRNFVDIAVLAPSVAPPNIHSTQLFAETSAVQGVGLSVGSQRNLSSSFIVDGLSSNDDAAGLVGMPYGVDAVEQFQVVTSGGQAELGRALGGYVNVITRSGTNQVRGTAYGYFRDDAFNAANALSGTTLPMSQQQFGASLGGPIARGRTFYFANVEQRRLDGTGLTTIADASVAVVNARLTAVGYPGSLITTGQFPQPIDSLNVLGKIDHAFNGSNQFSIRYSLYDVYSENSRGAGGLGAPSASAGLDNRDQAMAFSNTLSLGTRTVNETRVQFTNSDLLALPTDPIGPAVSIAGVASFGTFPSSPQGRLNRMFQAANNVSQQRGAHAPRAGVDVIYNDDLITFPRTVRGSYTFSSLTNFLAGTYNNAGFSQTFAETQVEQGNANLGLYVQDEWSATPDLTLNLGLRYDLQWLDTIDTDGNNVSPRAGFAWTPFESRTLVVRGGAGLFFDRVPLRALANALLSADNTTDINQLQQNQPEPLAWPGRRAGVPQYPPGAGAPGDAGQSDDDAAGPAERVLTAGEPRGRTAGRTARCPERGVLVCARGRAADVHQPERAFLYALGHQQWLPADSRLREQQPVLVGRRVCLSRPAGVVQPTGWLEMLRRPCSIAIQRRTGAVRLPVPSTGRQPDGGTCAAVTDSSDACPPRPLACAEAPVPRRRRPRVCRTARHRPCICRGRTGTPRVHPGGPARGARSTRRHRHPGAGGCDRPGNLHPGHRVPWRGHGPRAGAHRWRARLRISPILAAQQLLTRIDPARLSGTVVLVRLAHVAAFEQRVPYVNPFDRKNLNRMFPGKADGTQAERIAWALTTEVIRRSDLHVELHRGDGAEWLEAFVGIYGGRLAARQYPRSREMGLAFGIQNVVKYSMETQAQVDSGRSLNRQAVSDGIPTILVEVGENGRRDAAYVDTIVRGVDNLLRVLKMLPGPPDQPRADVRWFDSSTEATATVTGIFTPVATQARMAKKGDLVGIVTDDAGRDAERIVMPVDGYVMYGLAGPSVRAGEAVVTIGLPARAAP